MPTQQTACLFLIKRFNIELEVELRPNGLVKIEPYQCREENLRLWSVVAKIQSVFAQQQLAVNKETPASTLLYLIFQRKGWDILQTKENTELLQGH